MHGPESIYKERMEFYQSKIDIARKNLSLIALLRMIIFLVLAASIYAYIKNHQLVFLYSGIFSLVIFLILIRSNFSMTDRKLLHEQLLFVNKNELGILFHQQNQFDRGEQFQSPAKYFADLDIFGDGSVFHLLNRTTTSHGSEYLASMLKQTFTIKEDIEKFQEAVKILSQDLEKRQLLTANGLLHQEKEGNLHSITSWLSTDSGLIKKKWLTIVRWLLPAYNVVAVYLYLSTGIFMPLAIGLIITWFVLIQFQKFILEQHQLLSKKQRVLEQYTAILQVFSTIKTGSSDTLNKLQTGSVNAHHAIYKLSKLSQLFDQRLNLVVNLFLNSLFLYDIQVMIGLEKWKGKNKNQFPQWVNCVGGIEYLNSLACFAFNNPDYTYPLVNPDKICIEGKQVAHPLIEKGKRIANDFTLGENEKIQLITGSNMSGKTTFLRTVGVNLLLAQCGSPVCASSFVFSPMTLLSSIRISDSLQENTSYFMAELKRLQEIIVELKNGAPALVLIDEILRGTNSEDKTHGSEEYIRKLLQYNCVALFATHDLNLSKLENEMPALISNYCFESVIRENELYFDYTLQKGVAKNKNASFLMKKMDII
jgi:hypothetical protein